MREIPIFAVVNMAGGVYIYPISKRILKMHEVNQNRKIQINEIRGRIQNSFQPDLRDLTDYCHALKLTLHNTFLKQQQSQAEEAQNLGTFTDETLARAIAKIHVFKEVEAPLAHHNDSSLRSMSGILSSLQQKAINRSLATGSYVHLTHVFYTGFAPDQLVAKSTFYGYKSAVLRYALKRVADLTPLLPFNVDKQMVRQTFQRFMEGPAHYAGQRDLTNVDKSVDKNTTNVDTVSAHRLTQALLDVGNFEVTESDPKLAGYPWFAARRHKTKHGITPSLTKLEMIELAECVRFVCHYPPDLAYERRGIAGKKHGREFAVEELFSNGLLLNAPKPSFRAQLSSKALFNKQDQQTRVETSKRNKRLASTDFNPSQFWLDVESRVTDLHVREVVATQLITGCRPAEVIDGVIVSVGPTTEVNSLGTLHFTVFGAKTTATEIFRKVTQTKELAEYVSFLMNSSLAVNSKVRGQFYHTETVEVLPQFPERVWLWSHLQQRDPFDVSRNHYEAIDHLLEKVCHYRKLPKVPTVNPKILDLTSFDLLRLRQEFQQKNVSNVELLNEIRRRNEEIFHSRSRANAAQTSTSADYDTFIMNEIKTINEAKSLGLTSLVSPYQSAKLVRFRFMPYLQSFPLMARLDGIPFLFTNVDKVREGTITSLPRCFLQNEFTELDLDSMGIPDERRMRIRDEDFASLKRERAEYYHAATVHLGKRYHAASVSARIKPTPYTVRHKIMSDLKGVTDENGARLFTKEDIARKAGHASTASQTGYGKAAFAEEADRNRGRSVKRITADRDVKNPKATAGLRKLPMQAPVGKPPEPKYEPKE